MKKRPPDGTLTLPRPVEFDIAGLLQRASPILLVVGAWLAFHPYVGAVQDARLYGVMALRALNPEVFASDLFFVYGSQDAFTLFTPMFAPLVKLVGLEPASMLFVALSQFLWLFGAIQLTFRMVPTKAMAVAGVALLVVAPTAYGVDYFRFGEGTATPRILAEGLTLWMFCALIDKRLVSALLLAILAALMHPLMGLAALAAGWAYLVVHDRRWLLLAACALVGVAAAAIVGLAPFDQLGRQADAEWLSILETRVYYLFPSHWSSTDWSRIGAELALAGAGWFVFSGTARRFISSIVLASVGGVLASIIGADLLHNVFAMQVQPYRVLWLLGVTAYICGGFLLYRLWRMGEDGPSVGLLLISIWLVLYLLHPVVGATGSALVLLLAIARLRGVIGPLPAGMRLTLMTVSLLFIGLLVAFRIKWFSDLLDTFPDLTTLWRVTGFFTLIDASAVFTLALVLVRFRPHWARQALPVAALTLVVASVSLWDRRGDWERTVTDVVSVPAFEAVLPRDATVYWDGDVRGAWLLLRRPSYMSMAQGGGLVFNRGTAIEYRNRAQIIRTLAGRDFIDLYAADADAPSPHRIVSEDMIASTCRNAAELDAVVLAMPVGQAYAAEWHVPKPVYDMKAIAARGDQEPIRDYYLYRCADLR